MQKVQLFLLAAVTSCFNFVQASPGSGPKPYKLVKAGESEESGTPTPIPHAERLQTHILLAVTYNTQTRKRVPLFFGYNNNPYREKFNQLLLTGFNGMQFMDLVKKYKDIVERVEDRSWIPLNALSTVPPEDLDITNYWITFGNCEELLKEAQEQPALK